MTALIGWLLIALVVAPMLTAALWALASASGRREERAMEQRALNRMAQAERAELLNQRAVEQFRRSLNERS